MQIKKKIMLLELKIKKKKNGKLQKSSNKNILQNSQKVNQIFFYVKSLILNIHK